LGGLLGGGADDLGDLLGTGGTPGAACLVPEGGDGLGGLGDLGDLGDLGGLLGGDGGLGDLGGLLGGGDDSGGAGDTDPDASTDQPDALPDDPDALVEALVPEVAEGRALAWTDPIEVDFLTTPELHARLDELLEEDADPAFDDAYERLLTALGAVPSGTDLPTVRRQLLDDQVAGFYSPDTGELVVRVPDDGAVGTLDTITLAHELQHALADQALGLPDLEALEGSDRVLAAQAVVEGDATLFMNQWALQNIPIEDQIAASTGEEAARAQAGLDEVPVYLQRELLFPYTDGLDWVCDQWQDGGWDAVDAAYASPPTTTAEILYGADAREHTVELDPLDGPEGFEELLTDEFGAAPLLWLFEAPGGDEAAALPDPREAAAAWAGGEVTIWGDRDDTAIGLALGDAEGTLCDDVSAWYQAAWPDTGADTGANPRTFTGGGQAAAISCDAGTVRLGIAPTPDLARSIVTG
ncbi:MAG: hypothetical protein WD378_05860, partial [Egicoccus sp.]